MRMNHAALRRLNRELCALLGLTFLLAGCSSGGGGASAPLPTTTPTSTATTQPSASPLPPSATATPSYTWTATPTQEPTSTRTSTPVDTPTEPPVVPATQTPTATPLIGPIVTALGVADASGTFNSSIDTDSEGRPVFVRTSSAGFTLYVEARPGVSGLPVATQLLNSRSDDPTRQPDLQILSSRDLGNGSPAVCDKSLPSVGGVPQVSPAEFAEQQSVSDALNDLACRFKTYAEADFACTQDNAGNLLFASAASTIQFCMLVDENVSFPGGETVLTVRVKDTAGNAGATRQLVVRIVGAAT